MKNGKETKKILYLSNGLQLTRRRLCLKIFLLLCFQARAIIKGVSRPAAINKPSVHVCVPLSRFLWRLHVPGDVQRLSWLWRVWQNEFLGHVSIYSRSLCQAVLFSFVPFRYPPPTSWSICQTLRCPGWNPAGHHTEDYQNQYPAGSLCYWWMRGLKTRGLSNL